MIGTQIAAAFENRTALVTGGTGLIGREVVRRLCDFGARVRSVSLDELPTDSRAEQVSGDLRSFDFCREITLNMDFVFHVAGIKGSVDVTKAQPASTEGRDRQQRDEARGEAARSRSPAREPQG